MTGVATPVHLNDEERAALEAWVRNGTTEQRLAQRARMVLEADGGKPTGEIAALLRLRAATVSK